MNLNRNSNIIANDTQLSFFKYSFLELKYIRLFTFVFNNNKISLENKIHITHKHNNNKMNLKFVCSYKV
jgi:hypothetical protein